MKSDVALRVSRVACVILGLMPALMPREGRAEDLVIGVKSATVDVYDDAMKFVGETPVAELFHARDLAADPVPVIARDDASGLVHVTLDGKSMWLSQDDLHLNHESTSVPCASVVKAKAPDAVAAAAMGLSRCNN